MKELSRTEVPVGAWKCACLRCGKEIVLFFNGGELDRRECCGLIYNTEIAKMELVITDPKGEDAK